MTYNVSSYRDSDNGLVAVEYQPEILREQKAHRGLAQLFDWWEETHAECGRVPRVLPGRLVREIGMARNLHVYDVTPQEPLDYRILYWGRNAALDNYRDGTDKLFRNFEPIRYAIWAAGAVHQVKSHATPALHYVMSTSVTGTAKRHRLMLPFAKNGEAVDRVVSAWVYDAFSLVE
jgi:hypothetical protein